MAETEWQPRKPFQWEKRYEHDNTEYAITDLGMYSAWEIGGTAYYYAPMGMAAGTPSGATVDDAKRAAEAHMVSFALNLITPHPQQ